MAASLAYMPERPEAVPVGPLTFRTGLAAKKNGPQGAGTKKYRYSCNKYVACAAESFNALMPVSTLFPRCHKILVLTSVPLLYLRQDRHPISLPDCKTIPFAGMPDEGFTCRPFSRHRSRRRSAHSAIPFLRFFPTLSLHQVFPDEHIALFAVMPEFIHHAKT
ncbi:hypothetical protein O4O00_23655 [Citrobacter sedlakii]|uniref:hypothetical protein n=1 Tax=Citrobacter sedlakii TaxID=67826 RepID=UPI0022B2BFB1|nr:hypothetical protein [Citrobacter sedlakii]MCZ4677323.1 hypothetical protein [Citrobacter sedlakii]MDR5007380.1 hypothetical protein [Citrobacter sedlakii]